MITLSLTLIWLLIIQAFVTIHYVIIERLRKVPYHGLSFAFAFGLSVLCSSVYEELSLRLVSILYMGFMYWIVFPIQLNLFRGKPLLYLGESTLDRFEKSIKSPGATLGMKVVIMIMCLFVILVL